MTSENQYFVFVLEEQCYAIALSAVEKVIRSVQITPLPDAPEISGLINMNGQFIPVADIRKRFHLPEREMDIHDRIIISRTSRGTVAFVVDRVQGVAGFPMEQTDESRQMFQGPENYIDGVGKFNKNTVFVCDINKLLSVQNIKKPDDHEPKPVG